MKRCEPIYNNLTNHLKVPESMGRPCSHHLLGSNLDNLIELDGRICYDSLGQEKTRDTENYHKHIQEVNHLSVAEHANLVFCLPCDTEVEAEAFLSKLVNVPGTFSWYDSDNNHVRITTNARVIYELHYYEPTWFSTEACKKQWRIILNTIRALAKEQFTIFFKDLEYNPKFVDKLGFIDKPQHAQEEEIWVSFWIGNVSRGLSHELVRHKFRTAVSQRSTRYVDESESPWTLHPLMERYREEFVADPHTTLNKVYTLSSYEDTTNIGIFLMQNLYRDWVKFLEQKLVECGISKFSARKQARGAARGLLGNALSTEMIFSASLAQWKRMINMRASDAADAEIRRLFVDIFLELKHSFPGHFEDYVLVEASDGCGNCVSILQ